MTGNLLDHATILIRCDSNCHSWLERHNTSCPIVAMENGTAASSATVESFEPKDRQPLLQCEFLIF